jgi:cytochrome P450
MARGQERHDLLSLFIRDGDYADKYLRDMIMNFVIAGRDTTAIALNWAFYCLERNPDVKQKVQLTA